MDTAPKINRKPEDEPKRRILIVDDKASVRAGIAMFLEDEGYEVVHAEDGQHILDMLPGGGFAAIISDNNMNMLDGIDALRHIRKDPNFEPYKDIPFFLMTGGVDDAVKKEVHVLGGRGGYFSKPFSMEDLSKSLQDVLENS